MTPKPTLDEMQKLHEAALAAEHVVGALAAAPSHPLASDYVKAAKEARDAFSLALTRLFTVDGEELGFGGYETVGDMLESLTLRSLHDARSLVEMIIQERDNLRAAIAAAMYTPSGEKDRE